MGDKISKLRRVANAFFKTACCATPPGRIQRNLECSSYALSSDAEKVLTKQPAQSLVTPPLVLGEGVRFAPNKRAPSTEISQKSSAVLLTRLPPLQANAVSSLYGRRPRTTINYHKLLKQELYDNHLHSCAQNELETAVILQRAFIPFVSKFTYSAR